MNISQRYVGFTLVIAVLVLVASSTGLLLNGLSTRGTMSWAVQTSGQDIANLVAAVALLLMAYLVNKGSVKAFLIWIGVVLTLLYVYVISAFDIHFNRLFLVYVAIVGLSFYTLVGSMARLHLKSLQLSFAATSKARPVSVFLLLVALLFSLLWLSQDIPALVTGKIPPTVTGNGLLTDPVHVLDVGIYLPALIITAVLLWSRKFLGYFLAIPLLVFSNLTGIGILAAFLAMSSKGMPTSLVVEIFFAVIIVVSLVLSALFLREVHYHAERRE